MNLKVYDAKDFPAYLPKLSHLYDELLTGGKAFRARLVCEVAQSLSLDQKTQHLLSQTVEFIHNASLLHDDLVDRSPTRRGKPAAWLKYTPEYAVLAGDYLLARVMVNLSGHGNIQLVQYTAEVISDLLEGEWLQDSLVGDFELSISQLDRVHNLKTSSLFKWCLRAPFLAAQQFDKELHNVLEEMGTLLGQLFQRGDDLLDFDIRNDEGKAPLGDLKSGYLNSFAAFACADLSVEQKRQLKTCESLGEFHTRLGGEKSFQAKVRQFDDFNEVLLVAYSQHIGFLKTRLGDCAIHLIPKLDMLGELMYWRKQKPKVNHQA
jgi:octaprenyl-diphosphate synthase